MAQVSKRPRPIHTRVMSKALERIEGEALKLPARSRARLARRLILSLDETAAEPQAEREWILEIERRFAELKGGKVKAIPVGKVFRRES